MRDSDIHLAGIAAGDPDAFTAWLAVAEPRVRGSLRGFAAQVDVEAVLQETLLRMWQVAPRVRVNGSHSLIRMAVRTAKNLAIDEARRNRVSAVDAATLEALESPITPIEPDVALRRHISECCDKLPGKPRQALDQRLGAHGRARDSELAAAIGMTLNTFLKNVGRARRHLLECLALAGVELG